MGIIDFFKQLFQSGKTAASHKSYLSDADYPPKQAIRLIKTAEPHTSKFGGKPNLPVSIPWPETPEGYEMDFIAQIHFPEIPDGFDLPANGTLFVFFDCDTHPFGFDEEDSKYWKIIYTDEPLPEIPRERISQPETPLNHSETPFLFQEVFLTFEKFISRTSDAERIGDGQGLHQMFGYPLYIQDPDMAAGYELLLQIDTDGGENGPEEGFTWGDCGRLFFWIKPIDLAAGRFDDLKLFLECY